VKEDIMIIGLRLKFQNPELMQLLINTGKKELIEDSPMTNIGELVQMVKVKIDLGFYSCNCVAN
jgi:predicted NAD-dependent protein-ADP-ribosyltransferase YbiA (DUF1768 family)